MYKSLIGFGSIVCICVGLSACASKTKGPEAKSYTVLLNQRPYSFTMKEQYLNPIVISTQAINGSSINLKPDEHDPKVLHASRSIGDSWHLSDSPEISIQEVTLSPYYSYYSYRVLSALQESGMDILNPSCPESTKYLVVFIVGKAGIPWAGCVVENQATTKLGSSIVNVEP